MPVYLLLSAAQVMVRARDHRFQQFTYRQAILRGLAVALAQHLVSRRIAFVQPRIQAFQGRAHRRAIYAKRGSPALVHNSPREHAWRLQTAIYTASCR